MENINNYIKLFESIKKNNDRIMQLESIINYRKLYDDMNCENYISEINQLYKLNSEIYEDIKNLQRIIIQYEYTNSKGKKDILEKSSLFANRGILTSYGNDNVTIEKQVVGVALGKWIETLKVDQFQFINKAFFKYKLRNNKGTKKQCSE